MAVATYGWMTGMPLARPQQNLGEGGTIAGNIVCDDERHGDTLAEADEVRLQTRHAQQKAASRPVTTRGQLRDGAPVMTLPAAKQKTAT